jgi:PilZ domain
VEALDAILHADDVVAVLGRDVPVRLMDVSHSGCLLQSETRLLEGTTGSLSVSYGGAEYADDVRVMRCQAPVGGDSSFRIGAQFLWISRPGDRSLRRLVASLQPAGLSGIRFDTNRST